MENIHERHTVMITQLAEELKTVKKKYEEAVIKV